VYEVAAVFMYSDAFVIQVIERRAGDMRPTIYNGHRNACIGDYTRVGGSRESGSHHEHWFHV
jgi:hypothetical protein